MNYENTKIYKIMSHLGDKIYIGSTTKKYLSDRMASHRLSYKFWKEGGDANKVSSFELFDAYGVDNCDIVLIESYPCKTKDEKNAKESFHIQQNSCVNKKVPGRTLKEYRRTDDYKTKRKEYRNKDSVKEKEKQFSVKYRENNQEAIKEFHKERYKKVNGIKHACDCGGSFSKDSQKKHLMTTKHKCFDSTKPA